MMHYSRGSGKPFMAMLREAKERLPYNEYIEFLKTFDAYYRGYWGMKKHDSTADDGQVLSTVPGDVRED